MLHERHPVLSGSLPAVALFDSSEIFFTLSQKFTGKLFYILGSGLPVRKINPLKENEIFASLIQRLEKAQASGLPGYRGQALMAPRMAINHEQLKKQAHDARHAAVLLLLYPAPATHLALIQRAEYPGPHSGQISFPGGEIETGDRDAAAAALRETEEEIAVPREHIRLITSLSDLYIPASHFVVHPFVGISDERPAFRPDPGEVAAIIEVPLDFFFRKENTGIRKMQLGNGLTADVPYFDINGKTLWGATAMILSEFLTLLGKAPNV